MLEEELRFDERGLIAAVVQDVTTKEVLMVAWMNEESLRRTRETGETVFWSRSRQQFWHKGATSGHVQKVKEIRFDCDASSELIIRAAPAGWGIAATEMKIEPTPLDEQAKTAQGSGRACKQRIVRQHGAHQ
jgi:phosphoribosyl-AMP cyclohydrolase